MMRKTAESRSAWEKTRPQRVPQKFRSFRQNENALETSAAFRIHIRKNAEIRMQWKRENERRFVSMPP